MQNNTEQVFRYECEQLCPIDSHKGD